MREHEDLRLLQLDPAPFLLGSEGTIACMGSAPTVDIAYLSFYLTMTDLKTSLSLPTECKGAQIVCRTLVCKVSFSVEVVRIMRLPYGPKSQAMAHYAEWLDVCCVVEVAVVRGLGVSFESKFHFLSKVFASHFFYVCICVAAHFEMPAVDAYICGHLLCQFLTNNNKQNPSMRVADPHATPAI